MMHATWVWLLFVVHVFLALHCTAFHLPWEYHATQQQEEHSNSSTKGAVNAVVVILVRNSEIHGVESALTSFEETFNQRYQYPYVFLNDVEFTDDFKKRASKLSNSNMTFGVIPKEHWSYPQWIDQNKAEECREVMKQGNIMYGGSESYRHMCRFNSGFFYKHPLLQQYDYFWRVEPFVSFFCTLQYDPFELMKHRDCDYGFTIMTKEIRQTIPTLWNVTKQFMKDNSHMLPANNALALITDDNDEYNMCHYWSNFEIGNLKFFRSKEYNAYFDHLDQRGGFFYERWGDAPVHSIGLSMFLPIERIHFFEDIGYLHRPYQNCPANELMAKHCTCNPESSHTINNPCVQRYKDMWQHHQQQRIR